MLAIIALVLIAFMALAVIGILAWIAFRPRRSRQ